MTEKEKRPLLISACLLGAACRYDGVGRENEAAAALKDSFQLIPVCPEQLGGLKTPRDPAEIKNGRICTCTGQDVTDCYKRGAREVLRLAHVFGCKEAVLKEKSPSCGSGIIYDGTFTRTLTEGDGVTSQLLKEHGIAVYGENRILQLIGDRQEDRVLETDRLYLRKFRLGDVEEAAAILKDPEVMYAYAHGFSDWEVCDWIARQLKRYETDGIGLWAVIHKETGRLIGQCGITMQPWEERTVPEIGYLFLKEFWHQGYAIEAALGCKAYAFETLGLTEVYSIIRENNTPSIRVAVKNGMELCGQFTKHYYGIDMPHLVYRVEKNKSNI